MKNSLVDLVIIIDKSGSMDGLQKDVVGGFNSLINDQKKNDGEVRVTTILFDHQIKYLNKRVDIKTIEEMTETDYTPSGCTALLDAIGCGIANLKTELMTLNEEEQPEHVIFSIMTDGYENSSKEYTYTKIQNMIKNQKKAGWDFLFQAANIDALAESEKLCISGEDVDSFLATGEGVKFCYCCASSKISKKMKTNKKNK